LITGIFASTVTHDNSFWIFRWQSIQWRQDNNIDNILEEDFSEILKDCPYNIEGHDMEYRPRKQDSMFITTSTFGKIDIIKC
jgi:hypothetical protein